MPIIARLSSVSIKMYFNYSEHNPPHIHAFYGEYIIAISIIDLKILEGRMPRTILRRIVNWVKENNDKLIEMWNSKDIHFINN